VLVEHFLEQLRLRYGEQVPPSLSAVALGRLTAHDWPGNVRELRNAVERAALKSDEELPPMAEPAATEPYQAARDQFLADFERHFLVEALQQSGFNVTEAARRAGVELRYFRRLLQRYGLSAGALRNKQT
jgi:two-component system C4-dicarboxylate transport response regulator DctD